MLIEGVIIMPYTPVTEQLSDTIRNLRKTTNTNAADLAKAINRSAGYISNLERGKSKQIELSELFDIFNFFSGNNEECNIIINQFLEKGLTAKLSKNEIHQKEEYVRFDKQFRQIKIPNSYIDYILGELNANSLTSKDVMKEVNSNRYIENPEQYEKNKIVIIQIDSGLIGERIIFELDDNFLQDIIDNKITSTNYINLQGLLYALFILKGLGEQKAADSSVDKLKEFKIYTLAERHQLVKEKNLGFSTDTPYQSISDLPDDMSQFFNICKQIIDILEKFNNVNSEYTLNKLNSLLDNLDTPQARSFTIGCFGLPIHMVESLNSEQCKELYQEIANLIRNKCKSAMDESNKIDTY